METLEWIATALCVLLFGMASGWLFLDWRREIRRAKAAARLALAYTRDKDVGGRHRLNDDEDTWPSVAQQPQRYYGNAATIPIPRQQRGEPVAVPHRPRHARVEPSWPIVDLDRLATGRPPREHNQCRTT
jgi:hypothetical protein